MVNYPDPVEVDIDTGGRVRALAFPSTAASQALITRNCKLMGFSFRETSGTAAAAVELYDGSAVNGQLLVALGLLAGQGAYEWFGPHGVNVMAGVFVSELTGNVAGAVYVRVPGDY